MQIIRKNSLRIGLNQRHDCTLVQSGSYNVSTVYQQRILRDRRKNVTKSMEYSGGVTAMSLVMGQTLPKTVFMDLYYEDQDLSTLFPAWCQILNEFSTSFNGSRRESKKQKLWKLEL
jgi:hypothetical protein